MRKIKEALLKIKKEKNYIYSSTAIFLISSAIGYLLSALNLIPNFFLNYIQEFIQSIIEQTKNFGFIELTTFIFLNNTFSSFFAIFYSMLFSFFSIFSSILNGLLIGIVSQKVVLETNSFFSLWQLLPHGIFEIPAVLISMGFGISFGFKILEKKFKIKKISKKIYIATISTIIFTLIFFLIPYIITAILLFFISLTFFIFVILYDKELKKEIIEILKSFLIIIIPTLFMAAIIETLLIILMKP